MKFQIGDTILIIHSSEEGEVINIIDDEMVMVEVGGVQFPIYIDQIDFPYFKRFTEKKKPSLPPKMYIDQIPIEKKQLETKETKNVSLVSMPIFEIDVFGDEVIKEMKIYLSNQTTQDLQFTYQLTFSGKKSFELANIVLAFQNFYIHNIVFKDWTDNPAFYFDFALAQPQPNKADHFETTIKIKPKQLFAKIEEMKAKNEPTLIFPLFQEFPDKVENEMLDMHIPKSSKHNKIYDASKAKAHIEPARSIIDLHIEKLTHYWQQLSNFEMLQLQLQTFEKYYNLALAHYQPSLIVIHGVGSGKLREEIHEILKHKKEVNHFVNQYHPLFGYGATEISFQY